MRRVFRAWPESALDNVADVAIAALWLGMLWLGGGALLTRALQGVWPPAVVVGGAFVWYLVVFWTWGLAFLGLDRARPAWAERWRIQTPSAGASDDDDVAPAAAVRLVLLNQFLVTLPALVALYPLLVWRGMSISDPPPPPWEAVLLIGAGFLWVEASFYGIHRLLHTPRLYRLFHHVHHSYRRPTGIATHYAHPLDHLLGNLVPVLGGAIICGVHPTTLFLWITIAVRNAVYTHGNHAFPLLGAALNHDFHHHHMRSNFGIVGLLDRAFGTDAAFREAKALAAPSPTPALPACCTTSPP